MSDSANEGATVSYDRNLSRFDISETNESSGSAEDTTRFGIAGKISSSFAPRKATKRRSHVQNPCTIPLLTENFLNKRAVLASPCPGSRPVVGGNSFFPKGRRRNCRTRSNSCFPQVLRASILPSTRAAWGLPSRAIHEVLARKPREPACDQSQIPKKRQRCCNLRFPCYSRSLGKSPRWG